MIVMNFGFFLVSYRIDFYQKDMSEETGRNDVKSTVSLYTL